MAGKSADSADLSVLEARCDRHSSPGLQVDSGELVPPNATTVQRHPSVTAPESSRRPVAEDRRNVVVARLVPGESTATILWRALVGEVGLSSRIDHSHPGHHIDRADRLPLRPSGSEHLIEGFVPSVTGEAFGCFAGPAIDVVAAPVRKQAGMNDSPALLVADEGARAEPLNELVSVIGFENRPERVAALRFSNTGTHGEEMKIVISEDYRGVETFRETKCAERVRASVHDITYEDDAVFSASKPDGAQEPFELVGATLDITDRPGRH